MAKSSRVRGLIQHDATWYVYDIEYTIIVEAHANENIFILSGI